MKLVLIAFVAVLAAAFMKPPTWTLSSCYDDPFIRDRQLNIAIGVVALYGYIITGWETTESYDMSCFKLFILE